MYPNDATTQNKSLDICVVVREGPYSTGKEIETLENIK